MRLEQHPAWRQVREGLVLILAAASILVGAVGLVFVSRGHLGLTKAWTFFAIGAIVYNVATFYLLNKARLLRRRVRVTRMLVATLIMEAPVVVLWLLFYVNVLPLPESMLPYAIGGIIVAPAMVMLIESLVLSGSNTRWSTEAED